MSPKIPICEGAGGDLFYYLLFFTNTPKRITARITIPIKIYSLFMFFTYS